MPDPNKWRRNQVRRAIQEHGEIGGKRTQKRHRKASPRVANKAARRSANRRRSEARLRLDNEELQRQIVDLKVALRRSNVLVNSARTYLLSETFPQAQRNLRALINRFKIYFGFEDGPRSRLLAIGQDKSISVRAAIPLGVYVLDEDLEARVAARKREEVRARLKTSQLKGVKFREDQKELRRLEEEGVEKKPVQDSSWELL